MLTTENNLPDPSREEQIIGKSPHASFEFSPLQELFTKGPHYSVKAYAQLLDEAMW
jgi:hypothetical protein